MNIALIAHDEKKELMVQFCIAYCGVLSRNKLCATGTTGKMVSEATGLTIQKFWQAHRVAVSRLRQELPATKLICFSFSEIRSIQSLMSLTI